MLITLNLEHYGCHARQGPARGITAQQFHFDDFTLDESSYRLQRGERVLRLEKRPMELLIFLVQRRGELVSRDEIAERLWGKDVFLDLDSGINTAIRKVRNALRDDPEKPRFIETVVGKGYRFAAPVAYRNGDGNTSVQTAAPPVQLSVSPALPTPSKPLKAVSVPLRLVLGAVAMIAVITVASIMIRSGRAKSTGQPAIKSIAVLPLKNLSGDPAQDFLADGMTEELIGRLSMISGLRVISLTSVMHFKDTRQTVPEIAKAFNVDGIIEGSVIREGGRVRIHAQLIRAATDEHFWSETYDRTLEDALALQSDVAQAIAEKVKVTLTGPERARIVATRDVSPEVYESYLKGRFVLDKSNSKAEFDESIRYFEEAIQKDSSFAPAYLGLADAYSGLGTVFAGARPSEVRPKAIRAARKALELDPELAEAHALLANVYQKGWQWKVAEAEYKRAIELRPNDAAGHLGYSGWLLCQGRTEEALAWSHRARELDPLGVTASGMAGYYFMPGATRTRSGNCEA